MEQVCPKDGAMYKSHGWRLMAFCFFIRPGCSPHPPRGFSGGRPLAAHVFAERWELQPLKWLLGASGHEVGACRLPALLRAPPNPHSGFSGGRPLAATSVADGVGRRSWRKRKTSLFAEYLAWWPRSFTKLHKPRLEAAQVALAGRRPSSRALTRQGCRLIQLPPCTTMLLGFDWV